LPSKVLLGTVALPVATFKFEEFYQRNRRIVIWAILFGLLWLLRDFFAIVFLAFVLAVVAAPVSEFGKRRLRLPHWLSLSVVYLLFLVMLGFVVRFVVPSVAAEANRMINNLPETELRLIEAKNRVVSQYPSLRQPLAGFLRSVMAGEAIAVVDVQLARERERLGLTEQEVADADTAPRAYSGNLQEYFESQDRIHLKALVADQFERARDRLPAAINALYRAITTVLLALLFSFMVLLDLNRIKAGIARLETSRVGDFYREAARPIVRFARLVGRAIEAQAVIAVANTILTLIGMLFLGLPSITMLSVIVFVCSFVPVLGVFISTTPIVLVALNSGGLMLSLAVIALVIVIHAFEAYLLNPLIYGSHLKLNPVLTLIILYVGFHAFGLWGMLLGVPVVRFFIHDALRVPFRDRKPARGAVDPNSHSQGTAPGRPVAPDRDSYP